MRTSSVLLTTVLCTSSTILVGGFLAGPQDTCAEAWHGGDGEAERHDGDGVFTYGLDPSLAGQVLIAAPHLHDPYFAGTMIYLLADDEGGSLGVVLNRPHHALKPGLTIWDGGPVGRDRVFVLHDDLDDPRSVVVNGVAVAADPAVLNDVLDDMGALHARIFVGYAGWAPGQLDQELAGGAWIVAEPADGMVLAH